MSFVDVQDPAVTQATSTAPAGVTDDYNPFTDEGKKEPEVCVVYERERPIFVNFFFHCNTVHVHAVGGNSTSPEKCFHSKDLTNQLYSSQRQIGTNV